MSSFEIYDEALLDLSTSSTMKERFHFCWIFIIFFVIVLVMFVFLLHPHTPFPCFMAPFCSDAFSLGGLGCPKELFYLKFGLGIISFRRKKSLSVHLFPCCVQASQSFLSISSIVFAVFVCISCLRFSRQCRSHGIVC